MKMMRGRIYERRRIVVISDVHLRSLVSDAGSELERTNARSLARLVETHAASGALVVVNGDLFDMDRAAPPWAHRSTLARWRAQSPAHPLWRALALRNVIVLSGNHDRAIADGLNAYQAIDVVHGGVRLRVEHGERFDAFIKRLRRFTRTVTWLSGLAERASADRLLRWMRAMESLAGASEHGGDDALSRRAEGWLSAHRCYQALILGHTHEAALTRGENWLLINSGQAMRWPIQVTRVDLETRTVRVETRHSDGRIERLMAQTIPVVPRVATPVSGWRRIVSELGILRLSEVER